MLSQPTDGSRSLSNHPLGRLTEPRWKCVYQNCEDIFRRFSQNLSDPIYGDQTTLGLIGAHTSYVERTNLTSRQMNGRLVRKTLSFSKELEMLKASSVWEDAAYNLTRQVKTLRLEISEEKRRFQQRSPAMAAGLTDHIWTIKELLWTVATPSQSTQSG
jgi:IS1 family transposase